MSYEDIVFESIVRAVAAILHISLFLLGILFCLSKITRYRGMLVGTIGFLGMGFLTLARYMEGVPPLVVRSVPEVESVRLYTGQLLDSMPWYGVEAAQYLFFACILFAVAGRYKRESGPASPEAEIDKMLGEPI